MTATIEQFETRIDALEADVRKLKKALRRTRIYLVAAFLFGCIVGRLSAADPAFAAADLDRRQFPVNEWGYLYYLDTSVCKDAQAAANAGKFVVPSTSTQEILERCIPYQVGPDLYRIDLRQLRWRYSNWCKVLAKYPYFHDEYGRLPLVVRMDWLVIELTDTNISDAQYQLLYRGKPPKTRDEFLKFFEVNQKIEYTFGLIEGESGVNKQKKRRIENYDKPRGYAWGTFDSLEINRRTDPLETPDGIPPHDGEEWIVGIQKNSIASGDRGALQVYLLANGKGSRVDKADGDLVEDYTKFRGFPQIRTSGSCIQCHLTGLNAPSLNEFRHLIEIGVDVYAKRKDIQEELERFHLSETGKELARNNEDFAVAIEACNGLTPQENALNFQAVVNAYDSPLTLVDAARELRCPTAHLQFALATYKGGYAPARLAALATRNEPVPRSYWEESYLEARHALELWRGK